MLTSIMSLHRNVYSLHACVLPMGVHMPSQSMGNPKQGIFLHMRC